MGTLAVVFPGQGSQKTGMAQDFCERFVVSRDAFAEASDALGLDVAALCFEEDPRLDLTEFTQPAILTAEIAMWRALEEEFGVSANLFGGHSLGEYTALCAAGVIPLGVAVRLVRKRGVLMQAAVPAGEGAMVAVSGPGIAITDLARLETELDAIGVDIANVNSTDQVVLSGPQAAMSRACALVQEIAKDIDLDLVPLTVSAPFHSRRMAVIEPEFRAALESVSPGFVAALSSAVTSNLLGTFHSGAEGALLDALTRQISGRVNWVANMRAVASLADRILEVGPARPLRGFFKSMGIEVTSVVSCKTAEKAVAA
jgi:[acyl-carrier-protein] S-malonyltransferase/trans-AT polyketide synthase/acyltransferase/oxidoreductase domain-containing protein